MSVMRRAFSLGVLAVKSAGNAGEAFGQGLFWADGFTGAGSIMVGAVDTSSGVVGRLPASAFSTYGPVRAERLPGCGGHWGWAQSCCMR